MAGRTSSGKLKRQNLPDVDNDSCTASDMSCGLLVLTTSARAFVPRQAELVGPLLLLNRRLHLLSPRSSS